MLSLLIMNFARFDKKTYTHAHNDIITKTIMRKTYLRRIRKTEDQWCSNEQFIKKNYEKGNYNKKTTVLSTPLNQQKKKSL